MTQALLKHLETYLGEMASGWIEDTDGSALAFSVARFDEPPVAGAQVLATLGLSNARLRVAEDGTCRQHELVLMFRTVDGPANLPALLHQVGMEALTRGAAYSVGDVLGPRDALREGASVSALYVALPIYFPDAFQVCRTTREPVAIGWLVPITASEAAFVREHGPDRFESLLEATDPDLLDFARASVV